MSEAVVPCEELRLWRQALDIDVFSQEAGTLARSFQRREYRVRDIRGPPHTDVFREVFVFFRFVVTVFSVRNRW